MAEASQYTRALRSATRANLQAPPAGSTGSTPTRSATILIRLGELSQRADDILANHWQILFDMGLAMRLNTASLASKYWTPHLSSGGAPMAMSHHTLSDFSEEDLDLLGVSLQLGHSCLDHVVEGATAAERSVKSLASAADSFSEVVHNITNIVDACGASSDLESDYSGLNSPTEVPGAGDLLSSQATYGDDLPPSITTGLDHTLQQAVRRPAPGISSFLNERKHHLSGLTSESVTNEFPGPGLFAASHPDSGNAFKHEPYDTSIYPFSTSKFTSSTNTFGNVTNRDPHQTSNYDHDIWNSTSQPQPSSKKGRTNTPWTPAEEQRLKTLRDAGSSWREISKTFPLRTEGSVKKHWYTDMHYAEFAEDESAALMQAIKDHDKNKWKIIGQKLGKPAKACEQFAKEQGWKA